MRQSRQSYACANRNFHLKRYREKYMSENGKIRVRNLYTVKLGSLVVGAYNDVGANFFARVLAYPAWARELILTNENGGRISCVPKLESVNSDPSRGMMKAVYSGEILTARDVKYVRVSLGCGITASNEMSGADIELVGNGEVAQLTATIHILETADTNVKFCSGDNPLVRTFLGCGSQDTYTTGWGECDFPSKTCSRDISKFSDLKPVSATSTQNAVNFISDYSGTGKEVVLFAGNTAAMRATLPYTYNMRSVGEALNGVKYKRFTGNIPEELINVSIGGVSVAKPDVCPEYSRADELKTDYNISLGAGGYVTSDPGGEYVGVVSNGYVDVYRADVPMLERVARVKRTDEYAEVLRGGQVALWSKTELKIFDPSGGDNPIHRVSVVSPTQRCILRVGKSYHAMYDEGNSFKRIEIGSNGNVSVLETISVTASEKSKWFISRCGDYIAYWHNKLYVKGITYDASGAFTCSGMATVNSRSSFGVGDCFSVCSEDGANVVYDFVLGSRSVLPVTPSKCLGKLTYGGGKLYVYSYGGGLKEITCDVDVSSITSAALAGDGLYAVIGGKLRVFYLSKVALTFKLPEYQNGQVLIATVKERVTSGSGKRPAFKLTAS